MNLHKHVVPHSIIHLSLIGPTHEHACMQIRCHAVCTCVSNRQAYHHERVRELIEDGLLVEHVAVVSLVVVLVHFLLQSNG